MKKVKLPPSVTRIMSMSVPILIENYALIKLKESNLSRSKRDMVEARVKLLIKRGKISEEDVQHSITNLKGLV
jgi:hypothetical protein